MCGENLSRQKNRKATHPTDLTKIIKSIETVDGAGMHIYRFGWSGCDRKLMQEGSNYFFRAGLTGDVGSGTDSLESSTVSTSL